MHSNFSSFFMEDGHFPIKFSLFIDYLKVIFVGAYLILQVLKFD